MASVIIRLVYTDELNLSAEKLVNKGLQSMIFLQRIIQY